MEALDYGVPIEFALMLGCLVSMAVLIFLWLRFENMGKRIPQGYVRRNIDDSED